MILKLYKFWQFNGDLWNLWTKKQVGTIISAEQRRKAPENVTCKKKRSCAKIHTFYSREKNTRDLKFNLDHLKKYMLPHLHLCWLNAVLVKSSLKKSEVYRVWGTKVKLYFVVSPANATCTGNGGWSGWRQFNRANAGQSLSFFKL